MFFPLNLMKLHNGVTVCPSPKPSGTVKLCIDPARLHYAFIRLVHHSLTVKDILLKLAGAKCLSIIDTNAILDVSFNEDGTYNDATLCQVLKNTKKNIFSSMLRNAISDAALLHSW